MVARQKEWYIADPVHRMLDFGSSSADIKELVGTPPVQRLRRISQLGLASNVFPGAVHTRFSHSLGAAHLAVRVGDILGDDVPDAHSRLLAVSALLHDVGHGPFSHSFERALKGVLTEAPSHEDWTEAIVQGPLAPILEKLDLLPADVNRLLGKANGSKRFPDFLRQIISSQLDVDRIDYLCRDAHYSGVAVGSIDVAYLIRNLKVINHGSQKTLGILEKGIPAYETFAFARHVMNRTVYYHRKVAAFECMMEECIRLLVREKSVPRLPPFLEQLRDISCKQLSRDETIERLLETYLDLTEDRIWTVLAETKTHTGQLGALARGLLNRTAVPIRAVASGKQQIVRDVLKEAGFTSAQFAVSSPKSRLYSHDKGEQVFVYKPALKAAEHISNVSTLVDSLRDRTETQAVLVVFDESKADAIFDHAHKAGCLDDEKTRKSSPPSNRPSLAKATQSQPPSGPSVAKASDAPPSASSARKDSSS